MLANPPKIGYPLRRKREDRGALANFVGASAGGNKAYNFEADVAVKSDTWLAASGDSVTDAKGAFITRVD